MKKLLTSFILIFISASFVNASFDDIVNRVKNLDCPPKLYFIDTDDDGNLFSTQITDTNLPPTEPNHLVIITHGWIEQLNWPEDLAKDIYKNTDNSKWLVAFFDWKCKALEFNPTDAAQYGRDHAGQALSKTIIDLQNDFKHIHLIGHSAGSWVITSAAQNFAEKTSANLHLTYLDAYVPPDWNASDLGINNTNSEKKYFSDHYYTKDITLMTTEHVLPNSHNFDLSKIDPGLNEHILPVYWYHGTVIGKYPPNHWFYKDQKLYYTHKKTPLGYQLSLESGLDNWKKTKQFPPSNRTRIKKPKNPIELFFENLFKKNNHQF